MIKKLVYGLAIIAGLVSCNDDYTDWASPQSNDSKEPVDKIAFTVEPAVSAIDFVVERRKIFSYLLPVCKMGR